MSSVPVGADLEPIIGWRGWFLRLTKTGPELIPAAIGRSGWPWRTPMTARCFAGAAHRSPDPGCSCGLYAYRSERALRSSRAWFPVIGTVSLWGRIVEHERLWRAEHAYPDRLRLVCEECLRIRPGLRTRVPVVAGTTATGASVWCAMHAPADLREAWPASEVGSALLDRYAVDLMPVERLEEVAPRRRRRCSRTSFDRVERATMHFEPPGIMRYLR
jgi:hypothetical protein